MLYHYGPMTASECLDAMGKKGIVISSQSHTRFTELRKLGVVQEVRERKCRVTGRNVIEWDVTSALPTKMEKKTSHRAKLQSALRALVKEVESGSVSQGTLDRAKELCG